LESKKQFIVKKAQFGRIQKTSSQLIHAPVISIELKFMKELLPIAKVNNIASFPPRTGGILQQLLHGLMIKIPLKIFVMMKHISTCKCHV